MYQKDWSEEMSRYEVVHNCHPNEVLLVTDSLEEACYFVKRHAVTIPYFRRFDSAQLFENKFKEAPPMLAPDVGTIETEWYYDSEPGKPRKCHVIFCDGHPIMLSDKEVTALAKKWQDTYYDARWQRRMSRYSHGTRPSAVRWYRKGNAHHRTMRLDDERDDENPRIRPGARVPDAWDVREGPVKTSKSWKDQSKRRRQWKPIDMPEQEPADDRNEHAEKARHGKSEPE